MCGLVVEASLDSSPTPTRSWTSYPSRQSYSSSCCYPLLFFEAGYTLRRKNFFRNLGTITMYAVVGTLISTFVVGYFTYACAHGGREVDVDATNPMEVSDSVSVSDVF